MLQGLLPGTGAGTLLRPGLAYNTTDSTHRRLAPTPLLLSAGKKWQAAAAATAGYEQLPVFESSQPEQPETACHVWYATAYFPRV